MYNKTMYVKKMFILADGNTTLDRDLVPYLVDRKQLIIYMTIVNSVLTYCSGHMEQR